MASTSSALPPVTSAIPPPSDVNAQAQLPTEDRFLRPASPRKRRRSLDRSEPSAKSLERRVEDQLKVSPLSPIALTGANEMAEQQKRRKLEHSANSQVTTQLQSPNPRHQALGLLRGPDKTMSKITDGPQSAASSTPALSGPDASASSNAQVSPVSVSSLNTSTGATATAAGQQVASPIQMGESDVPPDDDMQGADDGNLQPPSPKSYTYPDPRLAAAHMNNNTRMHSVSGAGGEAHRSPSGSNKKHKCPYCETEFTRHHNLKSHLLTHSQEKPFLCAQCDMRFRRLHDLKRHTKLHTGERPHVCTICNRKFARGDALARHTKGAGGCAGHRASVGSYATEAGEGGEMVIDMMYPGAETQEPGEMDENDGPGRQLRQGQYSGNMQARQGTGMPQTYPPVAGRGGPHLQAPPQTYSGNASPAQQHGPYLHSNQQGSYPPPFPHGSMTESPGPISPSAGPHDPRRSSVSSQLHRYAQQGSTHAQNSPQAPTATMGLPPPNVAVPSNAPSNAQYGSQHLPSLPSITTSDQRGHASHGHAHNASGSYQSAPGSASTHNSLSSQGQGSGERAALGIDEKERMFAIIFSLQKNVDDLKRVVDDQNRKADEQNAKIGSLTSEVDGLRTRLDGTVAKPSTAVSNAS